MPPTLAQTSANPQERHNPFRYLRWAFAPIARPTLASTLAALERHVSLELDNDGPFAEERLERRGDPTSPWPVLARLPRIEAAAAPPRAPLPTFAAAHPQVGRPQLTFVDQPHAEHTQSRPTPAPPAPTPLPATRHYRIDRAAERHAVGPPHQAPADHASLSDSVFRLHASLMPHMGLLGAAALVLSASLVYWVAIGRQGASTPPTNLLDFRSGLTQESTIDVESETPAAATPEPSASALDQPPIDWNAPRIANAPAPAADAPNSTNPSGPILPPSVATDFDNGITPTLQLGQYPITPFPPFSFVDQTPATYSSPANATYSSPAAASAR